MRRARCERSGEGRLPARAARGALPIPRAGALDSQRQPAGGSRAGSHRLVGHEAGSDGRSCAGRLGAQSPAVSVLRRGDRPAPTPIRTTLAWREAGVGVGGKVRSAPRRVTSRVSDPLGKAGLRQRNTDHRHCVFEDLVGPAERPDRLNRCGDTLKARLQPLLVWLFTLYLMLCVSD